MRLKLAAAPVMVLTLALTGCGSNGNDNASGDGQGAAATYGADCRNVTMIINNAAGGATDTWARLFAKGLSKQIGKEVTPKNVTGAAGAVGLNAVKNADPDGCTFGNGNIPSVLKYLYPGSDYPHRKEDWLIVGSVGSVSDAIFVKGDSKFDTLKAVVDDAKSSGRTINVASEGPGSADAVAYATLEKETGVKVNQVIISTGPEKLTALLSNQVEFYVGATSGLLSAVKAGQVKAVASLTNEENETLPGVTTATAQGIKLVNGNLFTILFNSKVPVAQRDALEAAMKKLSEDPAYIADNDKLGVPVKFYTHDEVSGLWDDAAKQIQDYIASTGQ